METCLVPCKLASGAAEKGGLAGPMALGQPHPVYRPKAGGFTALWQAHHEISSRLTGTE